MPVPAVAVITPVLLIVIVAVGPPAAGGVVEDIPAPACTLTNVTTRLPLSNTCGAFSEPLNCAPPKIPMPPATLSAFCK